MPIGHAGFSLWGWLEGHRKSLRPLNWWFVSRLERINRTATQATLVKTKQQFVQKLKGFQNRQFGFVGRVAPGIYRLTLEITNRAGKTLDKYQQFYRAVSARSDLQLRTSADTFAPGQTGYYKLLNFGTVPAAFGYGYQLWNSQGEEVPIKEGFIGILLSLEAGAASSCFTFTVPQDLPSGEYTLSIEVSDRLRDDVVLRAPFNVAS